MSKQNVINNSDKLDINFMSDEEVMIYLINITNPNLNN